jgi:AbiTii
MSQHNSIVLQLQQLAIDSTQPVSELLQKAKVVAFKLDQQDALKWIELELSGYKESIPEFRVHKAIPEYFNPWRGWIPRQCSHEI